MSRYQNLDIPFLIWLRLSVDYLQGTDWSFDRESQSGNQGSRSKMWGSTRNSNHRIVLILFQDPRKKKTHFRFSFPSSPCNHYSNSNILDYSRWSSRVDFNYSVGRLGISETREQRSAGCRSKVGASANHYLPLVSLPHLPPKKWKIGRIATSPALGSTWHSSSSKHQRATEGCRQRAQKRGPPRHGSRVPLAVSLRTSSVASSLWGKDAVHRRTPHPRETYVLRPTSCIPRPAPRRSPGRGPSPPDLGARISRPRSRRTGRSLSCFPARDEILSIHKE